MKIYNIFLLPGLLSIFALTIAWANETRNYKNYHSRVNDVEKLILVEEYGAALSIYENLFIDYEFIFLRDYQVATQIALKSGDKTKAFRYLCAGIAAGWEMKSINRNKYLSDLRKDNKWKSIRREYDSLRNSYLGRIDQQLREKTKKMFIKDQRKAFGALFTFSPRGQDRYAERYFAPHSVKQLGELINVLEEKGYPGEKLIGNDYWTATILSHHNSISTEYAHSDTLYQFLKPKLLEKIINGQMSPCEYAVIDDWYRAVKSKGMESGYGFLNSPSIFELTEVNELRQRIGLRTVETRNKLLDIEKKTGMNFYLPGSPWVNGKIMIKD